MSSIADLLAVGSEMVHDGVKYQLRKPKLIEQARFSQWLKDQAKAEAGRGDLPDEVREGLYRAAMRDAGELWYAPDSPGYVAALQKPAGFARLLFIIFQADHPEITEDKVQEILEAGLKEQFVKLVAAEINDPKSLELVLSILGFQPDYLSSSASSSSDVATPHTEAPATSPP